MLLDAETLHMNDIQKVYEELKKGKVDPLERKFLTRIIEEEGEHYKALADLRFYYVDPANWFMEKSRSGLDGAGAVT